MTSPVDHVVAHPQRSEGKITLLKWAQHHRCRFIRSPRRRGQAMSAISYARRRLANPSPCSRRLASPAARVPQAASPPQNPPRNSRRLMAAPRHRSQHRIGSGEYFGRDRSKGQSMSALGVRRGKAAFSSGCKAHPATAPAGSNRSSHGGNEVAEAFD